MFKSPQNSKTLVFAAHPDDDIIGCGGSLAKYAKENAITVVYLTSGDAGNPTVSKKDLSKIRESEATNATSVLGIKDLIFLHKSDGFLQCDKQTLVSITNIIREKKPNVVYTHSSQDFHPDHKTAYELTNRAIFMAGGQNFQEVNGKPWATKIVCTYEVMTPFSMPNYIEDITEFMCLKLEALSRHESQKNLNCEDWVEGLNKYRGGSTGIGKYAEAFKIERIANR